MAFLCPSRLGNASRARSKGREPARRGRITGSDSIDTVDLAGLEALINQNRRQKQNESCKDENKDTRLTSKHRNKNNNFIEFIGNKKPKPETFTNSVTDLSRTNSISSSRFSEYSADLSEANSEIDSEISRNMSPLFKPRRAGEKTIQYPNMEVKQFYKTSHGQYIVLFDFDGSNENDVDVERAELVEVLNIEDPDWSWVRKYDGLEGFVPKTYICPVEPLRKLVNGGSIQRKQNTKHYNYGHGYDQFDSSFVSDTSATVSSSSEPSSSFLEKTTRYPLNSHTENHDSMFSENEQFQPSSIKHKDNFENTNRNFQHQTNRFSHEKDTWENEIIEARAEAMYLTPTIDERYKASTSTLNDTTLDYYLSKAPIKSPSCSTLSTPQASGHPSIFTESFKYSDESNQSLEKSLTDVKVKTKSDQQSCSEKLKTIDSAHNHDFRTHDQNRCSDETLQHTDIIWEKSQPVTKTDPFKDVTEELATILKKRKQMVEGIASSDDKRENEVESDISFNSTGEVMVQSTRRLAVAPPDYETAVMNRHNQCVNGLSKQNHTHQSKTTEHIYNHNKFAINDLVEYIMKYEYKGQSHGQHNVYIQKGEAIYADLKNQKSSEWIWVYIPRTEQYGYIPAAYAEQQKTIVL